MTRGNKIMTVSSSRVNMANAIITADVDAKDYDKILDRVAKETSKNISISGFRKGKVPSKLVKQRYGKELQGDTENQIVADIFEQGLKELGLSKEDVIAEPKFEKFDKQDG